MRHDEKIVGDYYHYVGCIEGFEHRPVKGLLNRIIGPNAWYQARFSDEESDISSVITEYRNGMAMDPYLGSITIRQSGVLVYDAQVSRYSVYDHLINARRNDGNWRRAVVDLTAQYK